MKTKRFTLFYGIELEGAWDTSKPDFNASLGSDYSVAKECVCTKTHGKCIRHLKTSSHYIGEARSQPSDYRSAGRFITNNYPDLVDRSCGFHVHVSFKDLGQYTRFTETLFWRYFKFKMHKLIKTLKAQGHVSDAKLLDSRLFKEHYYTNRYPSTPFIPDKQLYVSTSDRYTSVNFCAYHKYHTIEFRMFPMFKDKETAKYAFTYLDSVLQEYLRKTNNRSYGSISSSFELDVEPEKILITQ
jgi:hypothetical protein